MSNKLFTRTLPLTILLLVGIFMASSQVVFAAEIMGTMNTSRTVKVGADECYRTLTNINNGASIKALGRNASGSWVFIWADVGDGWVPASSVNLNGNVSDLNVWADAFNGEVCASQPTFDARVCGRPGNTTAASTTRWTDIFTTADPASTTGRAYTPGTSLTILGRDFWGCWVSVQGAGDAGWIPVDALTDRGVMDLPVLVDNSGGCQIMDDGSVRCP